MRKIIISIATFILVVMPAFAHANYIHVSIAPQTLEFHLENPNGLITGYTPNGIQKSILEIPRYDKGGVFSYDPSTDPYDYLHVIEGEYIKYQLTGKYKIIVYGANTPVIANIDLAFRWSENHSWSAEYFGRHLIYPNAVWTYEFDFPVTPPIDKKVALTKVSTPADLIKDLTTAGQLNYIGNPKFVSELTKEINEIEAEKAKGNIDDGLTPAQKAKKEYTELLSEITEKYNKPEGDEFVKKEAYDVLKEDIEYIINHIQ